ncbi:helix-turn-helix domain-containing protein [Streptomyces broussonetiae]|uniref:helix-turn-helix domain-containing protein n=1 Tax=Streptomyces broussonetiae TaxID=2686304 RepID=UPI0018EF093F|nr:helix-turn-helix domain-containing protein [Streptomyces broussonetiae]
MTEKKRNAPAHPRPRPSSGVTHENEPLRDNFTVISNDLAQHPELSFSAIGVATHIQSLPEGTPVGIKALAANSPDGEIPIAAALRELEEHGFLSRTKERLPSGQVTTRTTSYNKPRRALAAAAPPIPPEAETKPDRPSCGTKATDLLSCLRAHDSRLLLTERDVHRLAPAVAEWLERGVPPTAVVRTLTTGLPQDPIKHPAESDSRPHASTSSKPRPTLSRLRASRRCVRSSTPGPCSSPLNDTLSALPG